MPEPFSYCREPIMAASENDRRIDYVEFAVADIARARAFYPRLL